MTVNAGGLGMWLAPSRDGGNHRGVEGDLRSVPKRKTVGDDLNFWRLLLGKLWRPPHFRDLCESLASHQVLLQESDGKSASRSLLRESGGKAAHGVLYRNLMVSLLTGLSQRNLIESLLMVSLQSSPQKSDGPPII